MFAFILVFLLDKITKCQRLRVLKYEIFFSGNKQKIARTVMKARDMREEEKGKRGRGKGSIFSRRGNPKVEPIRNPLTSPALQS